MSRTGGCNISESMSVSLHLLKTKVLERERERWRSVEQNSGSSIQKLPCCFLTFSLCVKKMNVFHIAIKSKEDGTVVYVEKCI